MAHEPERFGDAEVAGWSKKNGIRWVVVDRNVEPMQGLGSVNTFFLFFICFFVCFLG